MPCFFAIAWAIEVLVLSSGLCSVARWAIIPLCLLASPVNLCLLVLNVSNIAILDFSSFTASLPPGEPPSIFKTLWKNNILICWLFSIKFIELQIVQKICYNRRELILELSISGEKYKNLAYLTRPVSHGRSTSFYCSILVTMSGER